MPKACHFLHSAFLVTGVAALLCAAQTQSNQQTASPVIGQDAQLAHQVPVMDGGAGPCSLALTVMTADGKPVYAATVHVHIAYGFAGMRRLDLDAGTNADGKVKFIGLPSRVHRPPLEFHAFKNRMVGVAADDPAFECQAKHDIVLDMPKPPPSK